MTGRRRLSAGIHDHGAVGLMAAIVAGSAPLRGAKCTEFVREFDPDIPSESLGYDDAERWDLVNAVCRSCPARADCWQWASSRTSHDRQTGSPPTAATMVSPFGRRPRGRPPRAEVQERTEAAVCTTEAATPTGRSWNASRSKPLRRRRRRP